MFFYSKRNDTNNPTRYFFLILLFLLIAFPLESQIPNSIQTMVSDTIISTELSQTPDTIKALTKDLEALPDWAPDPRKATLWALIPGGGQIYNWKHHDKWWAATLKLTAIYGGFGTLTYFIIQNTNDYRDFRNAYKWVSTNGDHGRENQYTDGSYSTDQLKSYMDYYQTNMEWCYFFTALLYGLQIVEATVTAHLLTFDVSDNLSLTVKPMYLPDVTSSLHIPNTFGFSLRYKVHYK